MRVTRNEPDSGVLGRPVLDLFDFDRHADFGDFEASYVGEHAPRLVVCKLPTEDLAAIHALESVGFRFLEFQVRSELRLKQPYDTTVFPYRYEIVTEDDPALAAVLEIAATTFTDDRFTVDPGVEAHVGGERYCNFVKQSLAAENELVHKLTNVETEELVGFNTCRVLNEQQVLLLIAGVKKAYKSSGLGTVLNYFVFNDFLDRGLRRVRTHQSGRNYPILNVEVGYFGFRVVQTFVVLRKDYDPNGDASAP